MTFVLWFTGLPCSGKTTISKHLLGKIPNLEVLDGDELVRMLLLDSWSKESRLNHTRRVAQIVKLLLKHNVPLCVSVISPFIESREIARKIIDNVNFFEVYVECSLETCEKRDVKGMFKKAREGQLENFSGVSAPYEIPKKPDLIVNTENSQPEKNAIEIIEFLKNKNLL